MVVVAEERAAPQSWALLKNGLWGRVLDGSHVTLTNVTESVANVGRLPSIPVGARFPCTNACARVSCGHTLSLLGVGQDDARMQQAQNGGRWKKRNGMLLA